ncbi:MAG: hypothetical protein HY274_02940 [Gammaproteobacteria bacterium]|nr:hypothetical protein [Gammaproteobacteria bacterium]
MDNSILVEISKAKRFRKAVITLVATIGVTAWAVGYFYFQNQIEVETLWVLPFFFTGLYASYKFWRTTHVEQLTQEAQQEKQAQELEIHRKQEELENKWYVRYPLAALMLWGAWYILDTKPDRWWLAAFAALAAAFFAREISFFLIVVGLGYLLFQGIASLPMSAAIIIGAIIIASAIKK